MCSRTSSTYITNLWKGCWKCTRIMVHTPYNSLRHTRCLSFFHVLQGAAEIMSNLVKLSRQWSDIKAWLLKTVKKLQLLNFAPNCIATGNGKIIYGIHLFKQPHARVKADFWSLSKKSDRLRMTILRADNLQFCRIIYNSTRNPMSQAKGYYTKEYLRYKIERKIIGDDWWRPL